jgi:branched-chain amino acid transport system substrate-binding protein
MKSSVKTILILILILILPMNIVKGQELPKNYGNIPDELVAFDKFQKAYKYHFLEPMGFYGAGREIPPPTDIKEVRIGFLGPLEGSIIMPLGYQMLHGAELAIEEANAKGGYNGIPFKLMIHNDFGLWGAAANEVVKMDDEGIWAWIGTIDDINSHVAIRATLKCEITVINPGDPDPTYTETNIPWVLRNVPDDRQSSYALVHHIYVKNNLERVAVIRTNGRYGRVGTMHFQRAAVRVGHPVIIEERFDDRDTTFIPQLERIKRINPDAILIWGNANSSGMIVKEIRELGMTQPIFGSDRMVNPEFFEYAGEYAEDVVTTCQYNPDSDNYKLKTFQKNFYEKYGEEPITFAAHAYDAVNMIIDAIHEVGLNRVFIRDVLTDLETFKNWEGVTGKFIWDGAFNNLRPIFMAKVNDGKFEFSPAPVFEKSDVIYKKVKMEY